jgi:hypothetical protein
MHAYTVEKVALVTRVLRSSLLTAHRPLPSTNSSVIWRREADPPIHCAPNGEESLKIPTREEWAAFAASCSMRDMGTHLCALPTGDHCPRGLVCLGCSHAQPKKSAVPIFRRMLVSHERELLAARNRGEPAGQIAARELEIVRIGAALRRADELNGDVADAIEAAADGSLPRSNSGDPSSHKGLVPLVPSGSIG